jgi:hypothetical protein
MISRSERLALSQALDSWLDTLWYRMTRPRGKWARMIQGPSPPPVITREEIESRHDKVIYPLKLKQIQKL